MIAASIENLFKGCKVYWLYSICPLQDVAWDLNFMADIETINFVEERYKKIASHYANKFELNTNLPNTPCYIEISKGKATIFHLTREGGEVKVEAGI